MARFLSFELPIDLTSPRLARDWLNASAPSSDPQTAEELVLLTSELVSNAVKHSGTPREDIMLRIYLDERVRVEVVGGGPGFTLPDGSSPAERWGGLRLVDRLARDWGIEREGPRTKVWFELG